MAAEAWHPSNLIEIDVQDVLSPGLHRRCCERGRTLKAKTASALCKAVQQGTAAHSTVQVPTATIPSLSLGKPKRDGGGAWRGLSWLVMAASKERALWLMFGVNSVLTGWQLATMKEVVSASDTKHGRNPNLLRRPCACSQAGSMPRGWALFPLAQELLVSAWGRRSHGDGRSWDPTTEQSATQLAMAQGVLCREPLRGEAEGFSTGTTRTSELIKKR